MLLKRFSLQTQLNKPKWERKGSILAHSTEDSIIETVAMKKKQLMSALFATCHIVDTLFIATLCLERTPEYISTY